MKLKESTIATREKESKKKIENAILRMQEDNYFEKSIDGLSYQIMAKCEGFMDEFN